MSLIHSLYPDNIHNYSSIYPHKIFEWKLSSVLTLDTSCLKLWHVKNLPNVTQLTSDQNGNL